MGFLEKFAYGAAKAGGDIYERRNQQTLDLIKSRRLAEAKEEFDIAREERMAKREGELYTRDRADDVADSELAHQRALELRSSGNKDSYFTDAQGRRMQQLPDGTVRPVTEEVTKDVVKPYELGESEAFDEADAAALSGGLLSEATETTTEPVMMPTKGGGPVDPIAEIIKDEAGTPTQVRLKSGEIVAMDEYQARYGFQAALGNVPPGAKPADTGGGEGQTAPPPPDGAKVTGSDQGKIEPVTPYSPEEVKAEALKTNRSDIIELARVMRSLKAANFKPGIFREEVNELYRKLAANGLHMVELIDRVKENPDIYVIHPEKLLEK